MARLLALLLLLAPSFAQELLGLAPPGAIAGFYVNNLGKSPYLKGIAADWKQSGMEALLQRELRKELKEDADLLGLAAGGLAAAIYQSGFFVIARPSPAAMKAIKADNKKAKLQNGWLVETDKDTMTGISRDLVFIATPPTGRVFLQGKRGLKAPVSGDVVLWGSVPQDMVQGLGLPPRTNGVIRTLRRFSYAFKLTAGGYTSESRLEVNPSPDPALASLLLPKERPLDAADLPQGYSVSAGILDLGKLGSVVSSLLREFDVKFNLDLAAFGSRYAIVTVKGPPPAPDGRGENFLGHNLVYWEIKDPATAEANLLALLQNAAAFATPEGQGGFKVLDNVDNFKAVEVGFLGKMYYRVNGNLMVLATSQSALEAASGKPWKENPDYQKFKVRIPNNAVAYSFGDQGTPFLEQISQLSDSLPQTIGNQLDQKTSKELADKLTGFLTRLGKRLGSGLSYAVVEGTSLVSRGFYEVRW